MRTPHQPSQYLPAIMTTSPTMTPAKIDFRASMNGDETRGDRTVAQPVRHAGERARRLHHDLRDDPGEDRGGDRPHPDQQLGAFIDAAAEPQAEHAPDLVGDDAGHEQDRQRVPVADEAAHARALTVPPARCTP